jgi:dihydroorotate dehydrogenase (NAD+) catalytic subunit
MVELNISCPNVDEGGMEFGANPQMTEKSVAAVKKVFSRPVIAKLSPNVTSIVEIAKAAEQGGADALSLINSLVGTTVDIESWRPRLTNNRGGLTGPAIKPIALAMVDAVYNACRLPIIGIGGIRNYSDAVEFFLCGASAVQIGTALFIEPDLPVKIVKDLKNYLKRKKLSSVTELIGKVAKYKY